MDKLISASTSCQFSAPLHWDGGNTDAFGPLNGTDPNGTAFAYSLQTCQTSYVYGTSTPVQIDFTQLDFCLAWLSAILIFAIVLEISSR